MATNLMTADQFKATGRDVEDLSSEECTCGMDGLDGRPGRVYDNSLWTEKQDDGMWFTIIDNRQIVDILEVVEDELFDLYRSYYC